MSAAGVRPWVEAFRPYLHLLGQGQLAPALAAKVDLSGVVQQTLAECAARPAPGDADAARGLLRAAFLNNLRDAVRFWTAARRDARREAAPAAGGSSAPDPLAALAALTTPSVAVARRELHERLTAAVAALPDDQRTAVLLHHLLDLPVGETAEAMGRTVAAAAGLLRRGLERLRHLLADPPSSG
jgi:RNA polymerase sigma-70 factor (ECF subfamily)